MGKIKFFNHAVFVLYQAIKSSKARGTRVYVCAIDASKAFDKINRLYLWVKLIECGIESCIIIILIKYYSESKMLISNGDEYSDIFPTTTGVRQGGPCSAKLFNIYIEGLIKLVEKNPNGVKLINNKIDIIVYADDVMLVSKTKSGLQQQLKLVEEYGQLNDIKYNPSKTVFLIYNQTIKRNAQEKREDINQNDLILDNKPIMRVDKMKYLGVEISDDFRNNTHIAKRKQSLYAAVTKLNLCGFNTESISPLAKAQLYKTFLRPVLLYGMENLNLNKTQLNEIKRIEGNTIKRLIGIPNRCHSTELLIALNIDTTSNYLKSSKLNFLLRICSNEYTLEILKEMHNIAETVSYFSEIRDLMGLGGNINTIEQLCYNAQQQLNDLKTLKKESKYLNNNLKVNLIREVIRSKNKSSITERLFDLTKFE